MKYSCLSGILFYNLKNIKGAIGKPGTNHIGYDISFRIVTKGNKIFLNELHTYAQYIWREVDKKEKKNQFFLGVFFWTEVKAPKDYEHAEKANMYVFIEIGDAEPLFIGKHGPRNAKQDNDQDRPCYCSVNIA